ncbi:agmatine deiminase family protein [Paenibacillus sp. 481]|uniref:agmatine deiminase family protein n=1 Tax=Paenibacillus sp. 481 TaxID=2835869 RepID=UPI001E624A6E|nr:agmatine deiminase family protein [Paenibacillus sp. 481]UHA75565.1 agmatine deiminase family protein [Paenibacillus sp. 481]
MNNVNSTSALDMLRFRVPGEFEPQDSVMLCWSDIEYPCEGYNVDAVSVEIVKIMLEHVELVIVNTSSEQVTQRAKDKLEQQHVDSSRIQFSHIKNHIMYPRDFGAEIIVDDAGCRKLVDFDFDLYGVLTKYEPVSRLMEAFDREHAQLLGIEETVFTRLISEGGDREFNGQGVMMTIENTEVNKRNRGMTRDEVEAEFKRIFNLKQVIWLPLPTFDDEHIMLGPVPGPDAATLAYRSASANGHIDEMCRFVDERTILLAEVTAEEAAQHELAAMNKVRLDQAYEVLQKSLNTDGEPFRIVRIPMPDPIYVRVKEGDAIYQSWHFLKRSLRLTQMHDGSAFPTGDMTMLPALSYCNFLILNDIVIGQKYWKEGLPERIKKKDEEALRVLQHVFPERQVVLLDTMALNLFGGGVHCHTRNVPTAFS